MNYLPNGPVSMFSVEGQIMTTAKQIRITRLETTLETHLSSCKKYFVSFAVSQ